MTTSRATHVSRPEIAFKTSFHAIRDWVRQRSPEVAVPASFRPPSGWGPDSS